jgi:dienelactone hydrolase
VAVWNNLLRLLLLIVVWWLTAPSAQAADPRADFLKLIDRPRVALSPQVAEMPTTNGLLQFHFSFASDKEQRVPGLLVKETSSRGRRPVVVALHGTGGNKSNMLSLVYALATNGFIAVAIDGRYHGERTKAGTGAVEYNEAIVRAWRGSGEHPFYYDTVWDVMRLVDYLKTRKDVDTKRIGLIGVSKGGIETYLAAAVDKRIAVAAPLIGVQSFHWALENDRWQGRVRTIQDAFDTATREASVTGASREFVRKFYDRVVPGIYGEFDGPSMLPLIAPRPLLVINSDSDANTPLPGVQECAAVTRQAYAAANQGDRFVLRIQENTGHKVRKESEEAAIKWFVDWLKP